MKRITRLPIFRSPAQATLLAELFIFAKAPASLSDLASETGLSIGAVHKEVERLESAGLVTSNRVGRSRLVEANHDSPVYQEMRQLLAFAFGPVRLLADRLQKVAGIEEAFVYGSWAASEFGTTDRQPNDIDLMVIGQPDLDALYASLREVEEAVKRPINATVLDRSEWQTSESGFLTSVHQGPRVPVV